MSDNFLLDKRSLGFAEDYVELAEPVRETRYDAISSGERTLSNGCCAALAFFAKLVGAKNVVEIGTGNGTSGLAFFSGMDPLGVLTSLDQAADDQATAREAFRKGGISSRRVRLIAGDPLQILDNLRDGAYDIVFINGNKLEYAEYLAQAERLLRSGGLVIINDVLWQNLVANRQDDSDESVIIREALESVTFNEVFTSLMLPLGEGLLVAVRD